jgi:hypothetical protein
MFNHRQKAEAKVVAKEERPTNYGKLIRSSAH